MTFAAIAFVDSRSSRAAAVTSAANNPRSSPPGTSPFDRSTPRWGPTVHCTSPTGTTPSSSTAKSTSVTTAVTASTVESGESRFQSANWTGGLTSTPWSSTNSPTCWRIHRFQCVSSCDSNFGNTPPRAPTKPAPAVDRWASEKPEARNLERNWIYEVLEQPTGDEFRDAIDSVAPVARRTMIRSLWRQRQELGAEVMRGLEPAVLARVNDEDPRVRLEAVVCAGQLDADDHLDAFRAVLDATQHPIDDNLDFAIWQSIRSLDASYDDGSILTAMSWEDAPEQLAFAVSAIGTEQAAEVAVEMLEAGNVSGNALDAIVNSIALIGRRVATRANGSSPAHGRHRESFASAIAAAAGSNVADKTIPSDIGTTLEQIARRGQALDPKRLETLAKIAGVWQVQQLEPVLVDAVGAAQGPIRQRLIESLGSFDSADAKRKLDELSKDSDVATRIAATRAMAARRPQAAIAPIVGLLENEATADAAAGMIVGLINRKGAPELLADTIRKRELPADLARGLLRVVRSGGGNEQLEEAIRVAGKLENAAWKLTPELRDEILAAAAASEGSAERGEVIYRREKLQCIQCHAIGNGGGLVGPNLISVGGSSQPDYILESLLAPSAKLKEGYTTLSVLTDEGEVINGIVIGRDDQVIRLRLADGKEVQIDAQAVEQEKPGSSLMPEGLLDSLTKAELVDLVTFLSALGREPAYTVSTEPIVRSLETLVYSDQANRRLNRTSTDTAASDDPAMNWRLLTSMVDGTIPLSELDRFKQHRETPPTSFIRFNVEMPADGIATIELPGDGIEAWVDSKPTPVWDLASQTLSAGTHRIVLAIDHEQCTTPFTIRLSGDAK